MFSGFMDKKRSFGTRYILGVALVLAMLSLSVNAQAIAIQANGALSLMNLVVSPQPVVSGSNVTISFQLFNSYSSQLNNVNLQLESQSPIVTVSPASSTILINSVGSGLYGGLATNEFSYTLHIPSSLAAGEYTFDVAATYQTAQQASDYLNLPASSMMPIYLYVYGKPNIELSATATQIQPGTPFTLQVSALNSGTDKASNVSITLINQTDFSAYGPYAFNLGSIAAGASAPASISLYPNLNVSGGNHTLYFMVNYTSQTGAKNSTVERVPVEVLINAPQVVASILSAQPQELYSGSNQTLTVLLQNTGGGTAKNLSLTFQNGNGLSIGSSNHKFFIGTLASGQTATQNIFITADKNASGSTYYLPLAISYTGANYQGEYSSTQALPVEIAASSLFNITSVSDAVYPGATYVPITFTIRNTGNIEAQQISFSLQTIYPITTVNAQAYVQQIAPGQSTNVTFYVDADGKGNAGEYPVTLYEQWTQANGATNQQYSGSDNYYATVYSGARGGSTTNYIIVAVVIVVIAVVAANMLRRRKKASAAAGKKKP